MSSEIRFVTEIEFACPIKKCYYPSEIKACCGLEMKVLIYQKGKEYGWTAEQSFCKHQPTRQQVLPDFANATP